MADPDLWEKEFPITSVTRADLVRIGVPRHAARTLTDHQMTAIATKMGEYYVQHEFGGFWEDAKEAAEYVLNQPPQPAPPQQAQPGEELL